nr:TPR and ankyrin repeat-containing protein [Ipomoea batatas]
MSVKHSEALFFCFYCATGSIYLNKCGEQEHEKAAECYTLARCYETAAKIYARQNCFSECLSVCSKGRHLYDMGLEYVEYWKQHAQERRKEIDGIEQKFLESCASDFFKCNDKKSMMKFVKAFKTLDHMRMFLKPRDCLDELLWLEEESGNYAEAAELAHLKGDLQREADLLSKAGNFSKASSRILWYVLVNALWVRGCWAAWPLKLFESKHELLKKAISFASNESDAFYESVCTEAKVMSHDPSSLCELRRTLSATHKCVCLRGEILCLRKIIDVHTQIDVTKFSWEEKFPVDLKYPDDTLFCDQLSVGTLCHFWNLWRRNILHVFESLKCLEVQQDFGKYKGYGEFCLNYFGVRRQFTDMKVSYLLANPDAEWVKVVHQSFLRQSKNMVSIDVRHLIIAARNYWQNEVLAVGLNVLETIESLYGFSTDLLSRFSQSMCLVNIYIIAKDMPCKKYDAKLRKFFQLSSMEYFEKVFPLDYHEALEENIISLRGTEVSRSLLEEFIVNDLSGKGKLTHGQIGRLMMIWLGSAEPSNELCNKIFERIRDDSNWKDFISILRSVREPLNISTSDDSEDPCNAGCLLVDRFHEALKETYRINWQNIYDYISPNCFLYLVERFLIFAFCSSGSFYTTKSSFLEWLIFQKPGVSVIAGFPTGLQSSEIFYTSITSMVHGLLFHKTETVCWIKKSKIQFRNYHKLLVLRLVVILCTLCMNTSSGEPLDALTHALKTHFIFSELPREFNAVFRRGGKHTALVDRVKIAEALRVLGNPALLVNLKENTPTSVCPNSFYLGIGPNSCREDIMEMLFPRKSVTSAVQKSMKNSCCVLPLIADHDRKTSLLPSPDKASIQNQAQRDEEVKSTLQMKWHILEEELVSLRTGETENDGKERISTTTTCLKSSEDLNECIQFMTAVVSYMSGKETQSGEDAVDMFKEAQSMLQELKELSDKLDTRLVC